MSNSRKRITLFILIPLLLVGMGGICAYLYKEAILSSIVRNQLETIEKKSGLSISFNDLKTNGIRTIYLHDINVVRERDTLATIHEMKVRVSLWGLLKRVNEIRDIETISSHIRLGHSQKASTTEEETNDLNELGRGTREKLTKIKGYISTLLDHLPERVHLSETFCDYSADSLSIQIFLPEATLQETHFYSQVHIKQTALQDTTQQYCIIEGELDNIKNNKGNILIYSLNNQQVNIPYIKEKFNSEIRFDTLSLALSLSEGKEKIQCQGNGCCKNLSIENPRLSKDPVLFPSLQLDYLCNFTSESFELDSSSVINVNAFTAHPYLFVVMKDTLSFLEANLKSDKQPSQRLFSALPNGLFKNLAGIETEGDLTYQFHFKVDMANIDSLEFSSSLTPDHFRILKMGNSDFREVTQPFLYHAFEEGKEVASLYIGEENPDFRHLEQISTYLQHAVLYSEDGLFFSHKGFLESATIASLIKNIKEKRFARGGSTISMQLVKNLWLSREKTLARKMEEALIVWLIENNHLISKSRMYEIYLNIIEWGPNVYGANAAARFYFNKEASELSLEEAIFMASIIPRPKKFFWNFDEEHQLKPFLEYYYTVIGEKLLKHNIITEKQLEKLKPQVTLQGEATQYLPKAKEEKKEEVREDRKRGSNREKKAPREERRQKRRERK